MATIGECPTVDVVVSSANNISIINSSLHVIQQEHYHESVEMLKFIAYGVLSSIIIFFGIVGNVINLVVLTRPNLKGVTFLYLTWLAISDLMSLLVSISSMLRLHGIQSRTYPSAVYFAHIEMPLVNGLMASSVFLVVALTIDRYFSVCIPTKFKDVHNAKRAKNSIMAAYMCAFILYIPVGFQKEPVAVHIGNKIEYLACDYAKVAFNTSFKVYLMVKEVIVRLGPVVLLAILNITIILTFRKTLKKKRNLLGMTNILPVDDHQRETNSRRYREEQRLIVLLAGIVILLFVTMPPAAILTILNSDDKASNFRFQLFRAFANLLELTNYALNFYVYCLCSPEIRRTFVALVTFSKLTVSANSSSSKNSIENNKY